MTAPECFRRVRIAQGNRAGLADTSAAPRLWARCYLAAMLRLPGALLTAAGLRSHGVPPHHDAQNLLQRFWALGDLA